MKDLSLKQPWAELMIETRKWNTNFRGKFYIHASKNVDFEYCKKMGFNNLLTGVLIGTADLVDVKEYKNQKEFDSDYDKHFAKNLVRYGFILKNVKRIKPVPAKGQLNFWNYNE